MIEVVTGRPVAEYVGRINGFIPSETATAIGLERDGQLVAGCVFEDWNRASFICHLAITGRAHKVFFYAIARYAFTQCGARKLIAPVYSSNARMIRMAGHMGFRNEGRLTDAQPDGDIVLFTMTAAQCRFLEERYSGKKSRSPAVA